MLKKSTDIMCHFKYQSNVRGILIKVLINHYEIRMSDLWVKLRFFKNILVFDLSGFCIGMLQQSLQGRIHPAPKLKYIKTPFFVTVHGNYFTSLSRKKSKQHPFHLRSLSYNRKDSWTGKYRSSRKGDIGSNWLRIRFVM